MKNNMIVILILSSLIAACVGTDKDKKLRGSTSDTGYIAISTEKPTAAATVDIPGLDTMRANNSIKLTGNNRLQYSDTLLKVSAANKITLRFTNIGQPASTSLSHNFVLLAQGTDFARFATEAIRARDNDYIPSGMSKSVLAHTKLIGPGESDEIIFRVPTKGVYDFLCTFPGHYGTMRGKLVAE